ncbi:hypothetical protein [Caulobacter sp. 17J65-9]|uniref:hypothetical protein n=1 Tax=Caulobacter sp. 17J65-9 TaxID=2709382 RepID=UPI0013C99004|nr:hypothetical protein [Caulobacter sp. 17J65-9]NEX94244.1 hypothetical protein [Caulobacter sp. 17J65-9]
MFSRWATGALTALLIGAGLAAAAPARADDGVCYMVLPQTIRFVGLDGAKVRPVVRGDVDVRVAGTYRGAAFEFAVARCEMSETWQLVLVGAPADGPDLLAELKRAVRVDGVNLYAGLDDALTDAERETLQREGHVQFARGDAQVAYDRLSGEVLDVVSETASWPR